MEFREAAETIVPFGKHRGKTIDEIAETDDGLRYLDWLHGWLYEEDHSNHALREAVQVYLSDPAIQKELGYD